MGISTAQSRRRLSYGLNDSPAGVAAWIVEKWRTWSDCGGDVESRFSKDELLTHLTVYWATQTISSSVRLYYESGKAPSGLSVGQSGYGSDELRQVPGGDKLSAGRVAAAVLQPGSIYRRCRAADTSRRLRSRSCWRRIYGSRSGR